VGLFVCLIVAGCLVKNEVFFGKSDPPQENVLRYVSGSEPESIDPQIPIGQNEARICMALYEGLVEYDPKNSQPIPALSESWDVNKDWSEVVFHLRRDGRFSNGDRITAHDFVYTIRRGVTPAVGARYASLAYPIKYAQAFNEGGVFVVDPHSGEYVAEQEFIDKGRDPSTALSSRRESIESEYGDLKRAGDTSFHEFMHSPVRLVLPGDEKRRIEVLNRDPKLKASVAGKEFVKVSAEDIGVEAVDDYTLRISLVQATPYFISMDAASIFPGASSKDG